MTYHLGTNMATQDFGVDVARGFYTNCTEINLFGFNRSVGGTFETIQNNGSGGIYTFPSSADTLTISSSSASDTMQLKIMGLDANRDMIEETVTLNGTTDVETTSEFLRVNDARILSGENAGDITVSHGSDTVAYLEDSYGIEQAAIYSVPRKHKLLIHQIDMTCGTLSQSKHITARSRIGPDPVYHFFEVTLNNYQLAYNLRHPYMIEGGRDFSLEAKTSHNSDEVSIYVSATLIREA